MFQYVKKYSHSSFNTSRLVQGGKTNLLGKISSPSVSSEAGTKLWPSSARSQLQPLWQLRVRGGIKRWGRWNQCSGIPVNNIGLLLVEIHSLWLWLTKINKSKAKAIQGYLDELADFQWQSTVLTFTKNQITAQILQRKVIFALFYHPIVINFFKFHVKPYAPYPASRWWPG